jgi:predicted nucleic acid-binding Zn ribbon protein
MEYLKPKLTRRQKSRPQEISNILKKTLKKFGLENKINECEFFQNWSEIVGEELAKRTKPECIRGKKLVLRVEDSIWAQELSFQKDAIIRRIKKCVGNKANIEDLLFNIGKI